MFLSEAVKCYYSTPFWVKMSALITALIFSVTIQRRLMLAESSASSARSRKIVALISLLLWFLVGASGRWIGFSG
jgi:hypothetical protein